MIRVDTKPLDHIVDTNLLDNLYLLAKQAFGNILNEGKAPDVVGATLYSLFKQIEEGDADEFAKNKENTDPLKYGVWVQQAGKDEYSCKREYILLVG